MRAVVILAIALAASGWVISRAQEQQRLDRLTAERDAAAEQNRLNYLEWERQQRAIPVGRPIGKPLAGQRDA